MIQKNLHHRSNLYSAAPMPYMQRITWSGVAMHEGKLPGYPASHGCIRLPREFAQRLWGLTRIGARVIIAQDEVVPSAITHARLAALTPQDVAPSASAEPTQKIRLATVASIVDAPLKGTIDANEGRRADRDADRPRRAGRDGREPRHSRRTRQGHACPDKGGVLASAKDPVLRPGPISIYISRKTGRLYLRKGFEEVLEAPVTIAQPDTPLGTHVFSALKGDDAAVHWNVASLPTDRLVKKGKYLRRSRAAARSCARSWYRRCTRPSRRAIRTPRSTASRSRTETLVAHQRADVARRLADHLRPRAKLRDRQGHGFHPADALAVNFQEVVHSVRTGNADVAKPQRFAEDRMDTHKNARLTPKGREDMVRAVVDGGLSKAAAARQFNTTAKTVAKWVERFRAEGVDGLRDRSSRPLSSPGQTPPATCAAVEALRRQRHTGKQIAAELGISTATVSRILHGCGLNMLSALEPAEPVRRYEREKPGRDHPSSISRSSAVSMRRPSHHRRSHWRDAMPRGIGWEFVHVAIDDHSRVAFAQVMPTSEKKSAVAFLRPPSPTTQASASRSSAS